jgi:hypothetical protein
MLSIVMLDDIFYCYEECNCAECHHTEHHDT